MADKIAISRSTRFIGRVIVMLMESTIHPIKIWQADLEHYHASSFMKERNSLRYLESFLLSGPNTLYNV